MAEPILIIHGVANHDAAPFIQQVADLQSAVGPSKRLIPVYWGNLGGQSTNLADCLPKLTDGTWKVRADDNATQVLRPEVVHALVGQANSLDNSQRADIVSGAVDQESPVCGSIGIQSQRVRDAVAHELGSTQILQHVDDPETLAIVGHAIDAVLRELPEVDAASTSGEFTVGGSYAVRSDDLVADLDTRGVLDPVKRITGQILHGIDDALGRFIGNQLGRINQSVRERIAEPISSTLGDIMSYQRKPDEIQDTLRKAISEHATGYGIREQPISVIAHSLGGVIAFDAAVNPSQDSKRLWIKSLVTFGSQAAFFHIVDPRHPSLNAYRRDAPVNLPKSIVRWTNLWDPMDMLAFTAGTVFRLADGTTPEDLCVQDTASELIADKGWAHSMYWKSDELMSALRRVLA